MLAHPFQVRSLGCLNGFQRFVAEPVVLDAHRTLDQVALSFLLLTNARHAAKRGASGCGTPDPACRRAGPLPMLRLCFVATSANIP